MANEQLALLGGEMSIKSEVSDIFAWPIVTERHEQAVLDVLRARKMSGIEITKEFEKKYAESLGRKYGLAYNNGTAAILGAMYGLDLPKHYVLGLGRAGVQSRRNARFR